MDDVIDVDSVILDELADACLPLNKKRKLLPKGRPVDSIWEKDTETLVNPDGTTTLKCKHCQYAYTFQKFKHVQYVRDHMEKKHSPNKTIQCNSMLSYFNSSPKLSNETLQEAMDELSLFFYDTATPFQRVENKHLLKFAQILNPSVKKLVSRKDLAGRLLDKQFDATFTKTDECLQKADYIAITTDGWSDPNSKSAINYMAVCSSASVTTEDQVKTVFFDADYTGNESHSAEKLSAGVEEVFEALENSYEGTTGGSKVVGLCTDNTSANKLLWKDVNAKHPYLDCYGCVCHALHLVVKDIVQLSPLLSTLDANATDIVTFFKRSPLRSATLYDLSDDITLRLSLPGETRWGSLEKCWVSLLNNKKKLYDFVDRTSFVDEGSNKDKRARRAHIKSVVTAKKGSSFVSDLELGIKILRPINIEIIAFQDDSRPISDALNVFMKLITMFEAMDIPKDLKKTVMNVLWDRWDFIYHDIHAVAFALDPRYVGKNFECCNNIDTKLRLDNIIDEINIRSIRLAPTDSDPSLANIVRNAEFERFRLYVSQMSEDRLHAINSGALSVLSWWKTVQFRFPNLYRVAARVFSCPCSSAASERNFSCFSFIHSKLRTRLSPDRVKKLVFIYANSRPLTKNTVDDAEVEDFRDV